MPLELLDRSDLDPEDYLDSYDLPDTVTTTIPLTSQLHEPNAHWLARGLLTETCHRLNAQPRSLDHVEYSNLVFISARVILPSGLVLTAELVLPRTGCRWTLRLNDHTIGSGAGLLPTPRWLADRIETAYNEDDYR